MSQNKYFIVIDTNKFLILFEFLVICSSLFEKKNVKRDFLLFMSLRIIFCCYRDVDKYVILFKL